MKATINEHVLENVICNRWAVAHGAPTDFDWKVRWTYMWDFLEGVWVLINYSSDNLVEATDYLEQISLLKRIAFLHSQNEEARHAA